MYRIKNARRIVVFNFSLQTRQEFFIFVAKKDQRNEQNQKTFHIILLKKVLIRRRYIFIESILVRHGTESCRNQL